MTTTKTPRQAAEELITKFGKEKALNRARQIKSAAFMRSYLGISDKVKHWDDVIDILISMPDKPTP